MQVLLSVTVMLVDLSVCNHIHVEIIHVEVSAALMQVTVSAANMWVTIFIVFMQMGISVATMQVVLSAECTIVSIVKCRLLFLYSYVSDTFK